MLRPRITISGFDAGLIPNRAAQVKNAFNFCDGIDIFKNPGILQVSQQLDAMTEADATDDITGTIYWMVKFRNNSKVYGLDGQRLYDYNNTVASKWSLVHTDSNTGCRGGMREFNSNLYWASKTNLGKFDGTTWTDSDKAFSEDDSAWHPMTEYLGKLMIGDGHYIATLDTSDTWDATALTLPVGYRVKCLSVYGDRLVIGTWKGTNIYEQQEATLFTWDGVSTQFEQSWTLSESGINAIYPWRNVLIVFAGISGNIYAFNGATLEKIAQIPDFGRGAGYYAQVMPGAVGEYMSNLIFGLSAGTGSSAMAPYYGIYTLGQSVVGEPIALAKSHILSAKSQNNMNVGSIFAGDNSFYTSWGYISSYGVDEIDISNVLTSGPFIESQVYDVSTHNQPVLLRGVEIIAKTLVASSTFVVKYKLDNASSWSTLGTITSSNQHQVLKGINDRAKTIQLKIEFTHAGAQASSQISKINIY
jgi:hypothetical protein